jgi:hypothetical protein
MVVRIDLICIGASSPVEFLLEVDFSMPCQEVS